MFVFFVVMIRRINIFYFWEFRLISFRSLPLILSFLNMVKSIGGEI